MSDIIINFKDQLLLWSMQRIYGFAFRSINQIEIL